jgi:glycosyltransferase involved in cell wall biosynthesis
MCSDIHKEMIVGTDHDTYFSRRYLQVPFEKTQIVHICDVFRTINALRRRVKIGPPLNATALTNCLHFGFSPKVVLNHFFNTLSLGPTPYVVTFEHFLPRWNVRSRWGIRLLAHPLCRRLIAMSRFAWNRQVAALDDYPEEREAILNKLTILHPSQRLRITDYDEKSLDSDCFVFSFVGRGFFNKGGKEVLLVFDRLIREGYPLKLNVVSSLDYGDSASQSTIEDVRWAMKYFAHAPKAVTYIPNMPNEEVIQLFRKSHVALLPTYDDTYGFSVLEAQACGCPVITTNVCALPEINPDTVGWAVEVPKDSLGQALGQASTATSQERDELSDAILKGLRAIVKEICASPPTVREKGMAAMSRISKEHDPGNLASFLTEIYLEALLS